MPTIWRVRPPLVEAVSDAIVLDVAADVGRRRASLRILDMALDVRDGFDVDESVVSQPPGQGIVAQSERSLLCWFATKH
jgi:hypothetical protein